ncbi:uncharacterized protein LOC124605490 [Schistocerca americana]|uniref:uncharacterized protein LOC124605490 n=1 Tax=Schistocerca americana TaxID=7009 RepID=UPI001F4FA6C3|nr:uncharacterized protein LOC124605490 [Schistocerca americana]
MLLFRITEILCFAAVLSADNTPLTTEKPNSLQQDASKTDVYDITGLFEPNAKSVNGSKQNFEHRAIALEGGSSVIANDTIVSESKRPKELVQKTISEQTLFDNGTGVTPNHSNNFHEAIQTEGGLLEIPVSTAAAGETTKLVPSEATDFIKDSFPLNVGEVSDHPSVVPRKGVSPKIVPRKGAEPYEPFVDLDDNTEMKSECNCCETHSSEQNIGNYTADPRCVSCCNTTGSKKSSTSTTGLKNDTIEFKSTGNSSNHDDFKIANNSVNSTDFKSEATLNESNSRDVYRAYPPLKKKSKPLVTSDTDIEMKQQKSPQSSSSEKSDFVIPVVLLILAVPVVVVLAMLFYRKGTEFWERRHYSKMDFLIDGMYNE